VKKLIIILVSLLITSLCFGQGKNVVKTITEPDSSSVGGMFILATASDTSDTYNFYPFLSFRLEVQDTLTGGSDSDVEFFIDRSLDQINWTVEDSITVDTDSTGVSWIYTEDARLNWPWFRVRGTGQAGNNAVTPTRSVVESSGWEYRR